MRINFSYILNRKTDKLTSVLIKYSFDNQAVKGKKSTGLLVESKDWEPEKGKRSYQRLKVRDAKSLLINQSLDKWESGIKEMFHSFVKDNKRFPTKFEFHDLIDKVIKGNMDEKKSDMFTFIKEFIDCSENRFNPETNRNVSASTIQVYNRTLELLKEFFKKSKLEPYFESFDLTAYVKFRDFLYEDKEMSLNTVGKHIKDLKRFANEAFEHGIEVNRAFSSKKFSVPKESTDKVYVTAEEITAIFSSKP